ncbi:2TM domain-containing protein [Ascidiimonas sp. W6]|uniref:2TM domain-containing protein n=1 Tax=Ascidiimonas meishanensis TaxID=3128903 RepID=UPI0030ED7FF7
MKNFFKTVFSGMVIGILITVVFGIIRTMNGNVLNFDFDFLKNFLYTVFFSINITLVNSYYFDYINAKIDWKNSRINRFLLGGGGSIILTMIVILISKFIIRIGFEREPIANFIPGERAVFYFNALLITIIITIFFHAAYFYREMQKNKIKEQKIIAGTASAQFDALKNQLDPHFLFNSLNVLTSLIEEDPIAAQKFTTALSKIYRYVLEQKNKELVTVQEEIDFAKLYVRLLKMRFEDSIIFEIPERLTNPEAKVVPLSLQLLLENAVKHNVVTPSAPLKVVIKEENGNLIIQNNLQPKQVLKKSTGVGLMNIRQRYGILTHRQVEIEKDNQVFRVKLPLLTKQKSTMESQQNYIQDKRYQRALDRVEAIKSFYGNLTAYLIVIPILIFINYKSTSFPWAIFPALGWGFGVIAHGLEAYGFNPFLGKRWEERKIKEYMEKNKN